MALKIRLRRMGRKRTPHFRIVVAESSMPRDGRYVTAIGHYNPRTEPMTLVVDRDQALTWIDRGARPTDTVHSLFKRAGVYTEGAAVETPSEPEEAEATGKTARPATKKAKKTAAPAAEVPAAETAEASEPVESEGGEEEGETESSESEEK